ncbi:MAG: putative exported protein of unknown function [Bradyrhizobium sp.]|jgi:hypothetical protein|nr:putative exported protein of unknown function [Bradyrhizobium sp.]
MRQVSLAVLATLSALAAVGSISTASAAAERIQDRYCLQGDDWGYPGNCAFSSYEQCRASASGTFNGCGINPRYAFAPQRSGAEPRRRY